MSDHVAALAAAAARAAYGEGGCVLIVPITGRDAPNVIDLESRRIQRNRRSDD